jgi:hypothetical protein
MAAFKGTGSQDRFLKNLQKWRDLGLKGLGRFHSFSEATRIVTQKKLNALRLIRKNANSSCFFAFFATMANA